jgi:hypothetical protein
MSTKVFQTVDAAYDATIVPAVIELFRAIIVWGQVDGDDALGPRPSPEKIAEAAHACIDGVIGDLEPETLYAHWVEHYRPLPMVRIEDGKIKLTDRSA